MSNVLNRLHELEITARKTVLLVEHLKAENARLKSEIAQLKEVNVNKGVEPETQKMVLDSSITNNTWKDQVVKEIDSYIEEIDHCIELLTQ